MSRRNYYDEDDFIPTGKEIMFVYVLMFGLAVAALLMGLR